mmetsp:Transcript_3554/g.8557  ORF Transcript_3554/g.8557 Transcript_3554/m.8557 type:complete len:233 (+) Transcript_3554:591-1289(+)
MFMAQDPQIPSRQLLRKVREGSCSFLILRRASRTIGPQSLRSTGYVLRYGFWFSCSGSHRYTLKYLMRSASLLSPGVAVVVVAACLSSDSDVEKERREAKLVALVGRLLAMVARRLVHAVAELVEIMVFVAIRYCIKLCVVQCIVQNNVAVAVAVVARINESIVRNAAGLARALLSTGRKRSQSTPKGFVCNVVYYIRSKVSMAFVVVVTRSDCCNDTIVGSRFLVACGVVR